MKKKGFTLIELLAIIVILAIIALIAVPVVLNIIDKARVSSYERSSENVLDAARLLYNEALLDKTTNIRGNAYDEIVKTMSGDIPDEGEIYINSEGKIAAGLKYGNYCYTKDYADTDFTKTDLTEEDACVAPRTSYKCIRASVLNTEECIRDSMGCRSAGYTTSGLKGTTEITYGNLGTLGESPVSGDAFDCDVDGTGYNHRFYYVTDLESNPEYAVLVYYNNTNQNGVADNSSSSLVAYYPAEQNWNGPVTAITNLPTIEQWDNISLTSTTRDITTEEGIKKRTAFSYTKTVDGETVPLAARLLTYQEVAAAAAVCGKNSDPTSVKGLDGCDYLMENTQYSSSTLGTKGYWLETLHESLSGYDAWRVSGQIIQMMTANPSDASLYAVRPAIEVLKSDISY